jgi:hypothetical protein
MKTFEKLAKKHDAKQLLEMIESNKAYMQGSTGIRLAAFRKRYFTLQQALKLKSSKEVSEAV